MQASDIIDQLKERYPAWHNPEHVASLRVRGIFGLITQAWEEGVKAGENRQRVKDNLRDMGRKAGLGDDFIRKFFSEMK